MTVPLPPVSRYRVAAIQFEPLLGEKERNLRELERLTVEAARAGARLIVHPEMATTGYCWYSREEVAPFVEAIPGPTTEQFCRIAKEFGCYIVLGMPEVDPESGAYYNAAPLVGPEGFIGNYRKVQPYDCELTWAKDGDLGLPVYDTEIGKIGTLICMDASLPETARMLALRGADVLAFPTNWDVTEAPHPHWNSRAWENGCYFVAANRWGTERGVPFSGGTSVLDPDGRFIAHQAKGDGIVYGEVDIARAREKSWFLESIENKMQDRRPELYHNLTLNTYTAHGPRVHGLYGRAPLPAGRRSRIGVVQVSTGRSDIAANIELARQLLRQAGAGRPPADLIVLPELFLTGVPRDRAEAESVAVRARAESLADLTALAKEFDAHLIAGYVERHDATLYNAAAVVGPDGLVGVYRKSHLDARDRAWASPGDGFRHFDLPVGRVGVLIGYDALFPESSRCEAVVGCDIIAVPAAIEYEPSFERDPGDRYWNAWQMMAGENNVYLAYANRFGGSAIFGPHISVEFRRLPHVVATDGGPQVLQLDISTVDASSEAPTSQVRRKEMLQQRRTEYFALGHTPNPPVLEQIAGN